MPDCLICLETTQEEWTPSTLCECRPILHRTCWKQWVLQAGDLCIICRQTETYHENRQLHDEQPIYIDYRGPVNFIYLLQAFILTLIFLATLNHSTSFPTMVRDEL